MKTTAEFVYRTWAKNVSVQDTFEIDGTKVSFHCIAEVENDEGYNSSVIKKIDISVDAIPLDVEKYVDIEDILIDTLLFALDDSITYDNNDIESDFMDFLNEADMTADLILAIKDYKADIKWSVSKKQFIDASNDYVTAQKDTIKELLELSYKEAKDWAYTNNADFIVVK